MSLREEIFEAQLDEPSSWELSLAAEMTNLYWSEGGTFKERAMPLETVKHDWKDGYNLNNLESFTEGPAPSVQMASEYDLERRKDYEWWLDFFCDITPWMAGPWSLDVNELNRQFNQRAYRTREPDFHIWAWYKNQMDEFFAEYDDEELHKIGYKPVVEDQIQILFEESTPLDIDRECYCDYNDALNKAEKIDIPCFDSKGQKLRGAEEKIHMKRTKEEREAFTGKVIEWIGRASKKDIYKELPRLKEKLQKSRNQCLPPHGKWENRTYKHFTDLLLTKAQVQAIRDATNARLQELSSD